MVTCTKKQTRLGKCHKFGKVDSCTPFITEGWYLSVAHGVESTRDAETREQGLDI